MRIYMDNCCFNRPFDDQSQILIRIESEAKRHIQHLVKIKKIELAWSYILEYENSQNPYQERQQAISAWKKLSQVDINESASVIAKAKEIHSLGIKSKDALHIACALKQKRSIF